MSFTRLKVRKGVLSCTQLVTVTVVPTKSDSDVIFCLQVLSKI